jgi:hypothetical protein
MERQWVEQTQQMHIAANRLDPLAYLARVKVLGNSNILLCPEGT